MRVLLKIAGALVAVVVLFFAAVMVLSEVGQEVVVLRTTDDAGETRETRIWLVEDEGTLWIRGGQAGSRWVVDLRSRPKIEIVQGDRIQPYTAVPIETPEARERVNALMAQNYGLADSFVAIMRDEAAVVPIQLQPHVAAGSGME